MTGSDTAADYNTLDLWLNKVMGIQKFKRISENPNIYVSKENLKKKKKKKKLPWFWSRSLEHKCIQGRPGRKNQQEF